MSTLSELLDTARRVYSDNKDALECIEYIKTLDEVESVNDPEQPNGVLAKYAHSLTLDKVDASYEYSKGFNHGLRLAEDVIDELRGNTTETQPAADNAGQFPLCNECGGNHEPSGARSACIACWKVRAIQAENVLTKIAHYSSNAIAYLKP